MARKLSKAKLLGGAQIFQSHGASEVYLFGSHATGRATSKSDVDFAVVGLPDRIFYRAAGEVMEALGCLIDLVDLSDETPFTRHLKAHGELVRLL